MSSADESDLGPERSEGVGARSDPSPTRRREEGWRPLLAVLGEQPHFLAELVERYSEPHRRYHGVAHLDALARSFEDLAAGPGWRQPAEVALAMLFHDAIYEPARRDNEDRSATLARERLAGCMHIDVDRVAALIEATAAHGHAHTDGDADLGHFLDADIAILGAPAHAYDRYARGVFEEYAPFIAEPVFRVGRRAFLQAQLARATLFHTAWFRERYEATARQNLERELASPS